MFCGFLSQDACEVLAATRDWICTPGSPENPPITLNINRLTNTGAQGFGDLFLAPTWSSLLGRRHLWSGSWCYRETWCLPLLCSRAILTRRDPSFSGSAEQAGQDVTSCCQYRNSLARSQAALQAHLLWSKFLSLLAEGTHAEWEECLKITNKGNCLCGKRRLSQTLVVSILINK